LLPASNHVSYSRSKPVRFLFQQLLPCRQVGPQPRQALAPKLGTFHLIEVIGVLALTAPGQRGGTGGVVASFRLQIVRQLRLAVEGIDVEANRGGVPLLVRLLAKPR
jgi:hypothetical protein